MALLFRKVHAHGAFILNQKTPFLSFILFGFLLLSHSNSFALPSTNSESSAYDRIRITIYVNEKSINNDLKSYCNLVVSTNVEDNFQAGEELTARVWANDVQILSITETLSQSIEDSGYLYKSYNCTGSFGSETTHEIRARVELEDDRWLGLAEDVTVTVTSQGVEDDSAENNDTPSNASDLTTTSEEYILRDADYFELNITPPADTDITLFAYFNEGPIQVTLLDEASLSTIQDFEIANDFVRVLDLGNLIENRYYVLLQPQNAGDYNFYQIQYSQTSTGECSPGDTEVRPCGNCGSQTRECDSEGDWLLFTPCDSEGICEAGETRTTECEEEDISQEELCSLNCTWLVTEPCPLPPEADAGTEEEQEDAGWAEAIEEDAGQNDEQAVNNDAGTSQPQITIDAGSGKGPSRIEQPPGQVSSAQVGCSCQEDKSTHDGRVPALVLLFIWWLSVRKTRRGTLSYFGRTFQGRWVSRHD